MNSSRAAGHFWQHRPKNGEVLLLAV